jgi:hypothetical protein
MEVDGVLEMSSHASSSVVHVQLCTVVFNSITLKCLIRFAILK